MILNDAPKGPFIATQLNSTRRWVELSCVGVAIDTSPTQLNSTRRPVELSCVAINGLKQNRQPCSNLRRCAIQIHVYFTYLIYLLTSCGIVFCCEFAGSGRPLGSRRNASIRLHCDTGRQTLYAKRSASSRHVSVSTSSVRSQRRRRQHHTLQRRLRSNGQSVSLWILTTVFIDFSLQIGH